MNTKEHLIAPEFRLPPHIIPLHYNLDLITNLNENEFTFEGQVRIKVKCIYTTRLIKLHARNLSILDLAITITSDSANMISIRKVYPGQEHDFLIITTYHQLVEGNVYTIKIPFSGDLKEDLIGYYRSSYLDRKTNTTKWLAVTHFEPTNARQAFPCFDEPAMKATFTIRLAHDNKFKALSNMPLLKNLPFDDESTLVWSEFQPTVPISTYLVAYMVGDFESRDAELQSNVTFKVWTRSDALDQTKFAASVGPQFLSFYEDFFNINYPLPKQDLLAVPDFKIGAMENWGIITFRENMLLLNDEMTSSTAKHSIAIVIAHELAHMWFGNLVTMVWWTDLWLKEGFATYMAARCVHHEFPEWNTLDSAAITAFQNVLQLDSLKSSHPVSVYIEHANEIDQLFDVISYEKGCFLLRMMSLFLGDEVFRHGITDYLKKHQYKNAEQDDLWAALTEQAHRYLALPPEVSVKQIMDTWTLQTGYPLITATRNYESNKVHVSQKRFLAIRPEEADDYKGSWWVPLSYSTAKEPAFEQTIPQHWLKSGEESIEFDISVDSADDWLILNNKVAGLYRINYDTDNWLKLLKVLHVRHEDIDVLNRAQLVTDAMDLANHGLVKYELAFKLLKYLVNETRLLPWHAALTKLNVISNLLARLPVIGDIKKFISTLLTPLIRKFGRLTDKPDNFEKAQLLNIVSSFACNLEIENWNVDAYGLFSQWRTMEDPDKTNPIPKEVRRAVYAYTIYFGKDWVWDFLWERYLNTDLSTEKSHILIALASSREPWLLNRYLDWTLDDSSGIRKQDACFVFEMVANTAIGYYIAKLFLFKNLAKISAYLGPKSSTIGKYFAVIAEKSMDSYEYSEMLEFSKSNEELLAPGSLNVSQSLEALQGNITWIGDHYEHIVSILSEPHK